MKVSQTKTKTIASNDATTLDADYLAFVQTLTEEQIISVHFAIDAGAKYVLVIVYSE